MAHRDFNLFLDDSGTKEYADSYGRSGGVTPYFVFGGLLTTPATAGVLESRMRTLKWECFRQPDVEIKANWLRMPKERKKRYLDAFSVTDTRVDQFVEDLYTLLAEVECTMLGCVVDKAAVQQKYKHPHYAPAIAYECVLQRVQMQMQDRDGCAHVKIDDMDGATPKKNQYKENLRRQHERLRTNGSALQKGMMFDRIGHLSFSDSRSDERLQAADLISYCVYRQFIEYADEWDSMAQDIPVYEYLGKLAARFCKNESGVIAGYGIVKFPMRERRHWGVKDSP